MKRAAFERDRRERGHLVEPRAGRFDLHVWGPFAPWWLGVLAAGMAERQLNIVAGEANRDDHGWAATFSFTVGGPDIGVLERDYSALAAGPRVAPPRFTPSLARVRVERAAAGDALLVELTAVDRVGLFAVLLDSFAGLTLFPRALRLGCSGQLAIDHFELVGLGGAAPSAAALSGLQSLLERAKLEQRPEPRQRMVGGRR